MKKLLLTCALLASAVAGAVGPNGVSAAVSVQNAAGNTGACTASSCAQMALQVTTGTIFTPVWSVQNTVSVNLSGTWSGTVTFQQSLDEGATWNNVQCLPINTGTSQLVPSAVTSATANGNWQCDTGGVTTFRAVASSLVSGTVNVILEGYLAVGNETIGAMPPVVPGPSATVAALPVSRQVSSAVQFKGTQGTLYSVHAQNNVAAAACLQIWCAADAGQQANGVFPDLALGMASNGVSDTTFPVGACGGGSGITIAAANTCDGGTNAANQNSTNVAITYQ